LLSFVSEGEKTFSTLNEEIEKLKEPTYKTVIETGKFVSETRKFVEKLQTQGLIAKLMKEEELLDNLKKEVYLLQETTKQVKDSAEKFNILCSNLDDVVSNIKEGQGTVGKFLTSDEIYREVLDFIKDIKAHPWKLLIRKR